MKKLILMLILFVIVSTSQAQWFNPSTGGIKTNNSYTWTVPQYFSTLIADLIITNRVDSTTSIRLYDTSGMLYALFSSDTSWIPNITVGNLNSTTIINGTSVTTNSLISDTIIGHSPINLMADSVIVQNKLYAMNVILTGGSVTNAVNVYGNYIHPSVAITNGGADILFQYAPYVRPQSDYESSLGSWKYRWDTVNANRYLAGNGSSTAPSYSFSGEGTKGMYDGGAGYLDFNSTSGIEFRIGGICKFYTAPTGVVLKSTLYGEVNNTYDLGTASLKFKDGYFEGGVYTKNLLFTGTDSTTAGLTATPTFTSYYGGNTNALGDPAKWMQITLNGINYLVPLYLKP